MNRTLPDVRPRKPLWTDEYLLELIGDVDWELAQSVHSTLTELTRQFEGIDVDGDGLISRKELKAALRLTGNDALQAQLDEYIGQHHLDDSKIDCRCFVEFMVLISRIGELNPIPADVSEEFEFGKAISTHQVKRHSRQSVAGVLRGRPSIAVVLGNPSAGELLVPKVPTLPQRPLSPISARTSSRPGSRVVRRPPSSARAAAEEDNAAIEYVPVTMTSFPTRQQVVQAESGAKAGADFAGSAAPLPQLLTSVPNGGGNQNGGKPVVKLVTAPETPVEVALDSNGCSPPQRSFRRKRAHRPEPPTGGFSQPVIVRGACELPVSVLAQGPTEKLHWTLER